MSSGSVTGDTTEPLPCHSLPKGRIWPNGPMSFDPRTRPVPPEIQAQVADCLRRRGPVGAAKAIGVSKSVVLSVAAGAPVLPGSLALLREYARRCDMAAAKATQLVGHIAAAGRRK